VLSQSKTEKFYGFTRSKLVTAFTVYFVEPLYYSMSLNSFRGLLNALECRLMLILKEHVVPL